VNLLFKTILSVRPNIYVLDTVADERVVVVDVETFIEITDVTGDT
jgi:hypothetical protein